MKTRVRANWSNAVMVCAKCSKKLDGGFGKDGRTPLTKALRKHLGAKKGRKSPVGIVDVKCLGVCPRDAVTVLNGREPGVWNLVPAGADLDQVSRELGLVPGKDQAE
ncbi:(2Fe-2S) ferredoxin domain-containing protein [Sphingomonas sp. CJ99]